MSLGHGVNIVQDGLVFYYDMNNIQKSWKGAPATNLFTEADLNNWSKSAITSTSNYRTPFDTPAYSITDNNTASYSSISRNITVVNDTSSYTLSVFIKKTSGGTSARLGFNTSFNGGTVVNYNQRFNSDTGVATTGTVIDYGDWWYWYFTVTNNGTGNTTFNCSFYPATGLHNSSDNVVGVGTAVIGAMMLVVGSTAARFVEGTRSNTQAILDLTNRNTLTTENLVYSSNNRSSFNGTDSRVTTTLSAYSANATWEAWVNCSESLNSFNMFMGYWPPYFSFPSGNRILFSHNISGTQRSLSSPANLSLNTWYHAAFTCLYDGTNTTLKVYVNGVEVGSRTDLGSPGNPGTGFTVGDGRAQTPPWYPFKGQVDSIKVYNRTLTANEVRQNFESIRSRYGI